MVCLSVHLLITLCWKFPGFVASMLHIKCIITHEAICWYQNRCQIMNDDDDDDDDDDNDNSNNNNNNKY